ncbi:NAD-dependent deacetylase [Flavobacterium sp. 28A]|uniref:SIR2 family NAD-dependent protein deacylase n=1 Tax=Flavobacterium sp. 28A TaxID=2735895 RepID=UPI00156D82C3|nr:Sir2 family NAD-dependent protein deacetylase [Flavobacterium sp. 28A]NRT16977.1 NAD-dependent deacetylase [Flavobacterium sp. 28A]
MTQKPKIVFFTGAGISAESGLQTFRGSKDGLWENHKIEAICTPQAWSNNPSLVLDFYNQRRRQCIVAQPNLAHKLIVKLEEQYEVVVITQNVDDLHGRAGSTRVIHLHGELMKARSSVNGKLRYDWEKDILLGEMCDENNQLRPDVVWFGEALDAEILDNAIKEVVSCSICIVVGTSLLVYPANSLPNYVPFGSQMVIVDPKANEMEVHRERSIHYINEKATDGMQIVYDTLRMGKV